METIIGGTGLICGVEANRRKRIKDDIASVPVDDMQGAEALFVF